MKNPNVAAIILAAGKGTRLKSRPDQKNKVTMNLNGRPMIDYTVSLLEKTELGQIIAVVGYASESVKTILGDRVEYALQDPQDGTGHATECGLTAVKNNIEYVLVLHGDDSAFFQPNILQSMIDSCKNNDLDMTFLTLMKDDPTGTGRILRDQNGKPQEIVEEKNATDKQKKIKEINLGMYCFKANFIKDNIAKIDYNPVAKERYLTDIIKIAYDNGYKLESTQINNENFWQGINTDEQLEIARNKMKSLHK